MDAHTCPLTYYPDRIINHIHKSGMENYTYKTARKCQYYTNQKTFCTVSPQLIPKPIPWHNKSFDTIS